MRKRIRKYWLRTRIAGIGLAIVAFIALANNPAGAADLTHVLNVAVAIGFVILGLAVLAGVITVRCMNRQVSWESDADVRRVRSETVREVSEARIWVIPRNDTSEFRQIENRREIEQWRR